jgi:hypothetical protein
MSSPTFPGARGRQGGHRHDDEDEYVKGKRYQVTIEHRRRVENATAPSVLLGGLWRAACAKSDAVSFLWLAVDFGFPNWRDEADAGSVPLLDVASSRNKTDHGARFRHSEQRLDTTFSS